MRALIQRVREAAVTVAGQEVGRIGPGLLVLLGVGHADTAADIAYLAPKIAHLRIFEDAEGKMNRSLLDVGGGVLLVSQFTLYADTRRGNRPGYVAAAPPAQAEPLYERVCERLGAKRGVFGAQMEVELVNDGPVTIWIDSAERSSPRG